MFIVLVASHRIGGQKDNGRRIALVNKVVDSVTQERTKDQLAGRGLGAHSSATIAETWASPRPALWIVGSGSGGGLGCY